MPIKNEKGEVVLSLLSFKNVSESHGRSHLYVQGDGEHCFPATHTPFPLAQDRLIVFLNTTTLVHTFMLLLTGLSETAHQSRKRSRPHFSQARERGRTVLHRLSNLFTKRGKRRLTDVRRTPALNSGELQKSILMMIVVVMKKADHHYHAAGLLAAFMLS